MMATRPVQYQSLSKQDFQHPRMWSKVIITAAVGLASVMVPVVVPMPATAG